MSLASLYKNLEKKQEELRRLSAAAKDMDSVYLDYEENHSLCLKPELSDQTWHGTMAEKFHTHRELNISDEYKEILIVQFPAIFSLVANKIEELKKEIEELLRVIAEAESEI
ncbi:YwqH-like family protein [Peribacillus sp. SCS-37]|uniref:YwqH-like family protein n=1 Tax=Paraperibacillus esterisolvens TaxID=3115296 RepID=UPI00390643C0